MKFHLEKIILLSTALGMAGGVNPALASNTGHDILVRNALDRPVQLAIMGDPVASSVGESLVQPHWELALKNVLAKDLPKSLALAVHVHSAEDTRVSELTHCQTTLTKNSLDPKIAVIIHQSKEASQPQCDIVDLNAWQERSVAMKN